MSTLDHLAYALLWGSFGLVHSLLAASAFKSWLGRVFGRGYRLAYNLFAVVHIGVVLAAGWSLWAPQAREFPLPGWAEIAGLAVQAVGAVILLLALRQYDLGRFGGLAQLREAADSVDPDRHADRAPAEPLNTTGLNAVVRHPIYLGAHLLLWGGVRDEFSLATALWASLYLVIGARFEERRLIALYGAEYEAYRARVPGQVPWPRPRAGR
jgi:protein-S-isoprenylcysteine O-methyltransferase Ste14